MGFGLRQVSHGGWKGPWNLLAKNSVLKNPDGTAHKCEDPHIWKTKRGWHLLTHNQSPPQGVSSYGYSLDGVTWRLSPTTPYDCKLNYTDGTTGEASGCGEPLNACLRCTTSLQKLRATFSEARI